jgi:hypothetical protein
MNGARLDGRLKYYTSETYPSGGTLVNAPGQHPAICTAGPLSVWDYKRIVVRERGFYRSHYLNKRYFLS